MGDSRQLGGDPVKHSDYLIEKSSLIIESNYQVPSCGTLPIGAEHIVALVECMKCDDLTNHGRLAGVLSHEMMSFKLRFRKLRRQFARPAFEQFLGFLCPQP